MNITSMKSRKQPVDLEAVVDRVFAMRHQEESSYDYRRFLPRLADGSIDARMNLVWREKICQWTYNVVDHFDLSREVVAVSLSLFDRYFATLGNKGNGSFALLTSLTTLHIAIKLHDTKKIKLSTLANLSRGQFAPDDIESTEWKILSALNWKLHPPTQYAFLSHFMMFLPTEASHSARKTLTEVSKYLAELAVCDSYFVSVNTSTVAFAAILNVMEDMSYSKLSGGLREKFLSNLTYKIGMHQSAANIVKARQRLRKMFTAAPMQESYSQDVHSLDKNTMSASCDRSISSVASIDSYGRGNGARTSSIDSLGSCRYSPSPRRRSIASVSPINNTRSRICASPIMAGV